MRPALYGLLIGIMFDVALWNAGPLASHEWLMNFLVALSTPVAYVISFITGWEFKQEEGILIYVLAIFMTIPLLGLLCGFIYSGVKMLLNRNHVV